MANKVVSLKEAISHIEDNQMVAIGGSLIRRHPMAAVYEIIRQRKKNLTVVAWSSGNDVDILAAAGCIKEVQTSYVGLQNFGLAYNFRRRVEAGEIRVLEQSESIAKEKFRAGGSGLTFAITKTPLGTSLMDHPAYQHRVQCPFTGEEYVAIEAYQPDVAIIHGHYADTEGNIHIPNRRMMDNEIDQMIAKSAKKVIVTVEQIVSNQFIRHRPHDTFLPGIFVDYVVEVPYGCHPNSCDARYDYDEKHLKEYQVLARDQEKFQSYLDEYVYGVEDHAGYLEKIGFEQLLSITRE